MLLCVMQRQAASGISSGASALGDATQQSASFLSDKAGDARDAVQDRLQSDEDRQRKEEEARRAKKKGPFGLF